MVTLRHYNERALTDEEAEAARREYKEGNISIVALAAKYEVNRNTMRDALLREGAYRVRELGVE